MTIDFCPDPSEDDIELAADLYAVLVEHGHHPFDIHLAMNSTEVMIDLRKTSGHHDDVPVPADDETMVETADGWTVEQIDDDDELFDCEVDGSYKELIFGDESDEPGEVPAFSTSAVGRYDPEGNCCGGACADLEPVDGPETDAVELTEVGDDATYSADTLRSVIASRVSDGKMGGHASEQLYSMVDIGDLADVEGFLDDAVPGGLDAYVEEMGGDE